MHIVLGGRGVANKKSFFFSSSKLPTAIFDDFMNTVQIGKTGTPVIHIEAK